MPAPVCGCIVSAAFFSCAPQSSVLSCDQCCKFVGTVWNQVSLLAGNENSDEVPNALEDPPEGADGFHTRLSDELIQCDCGYTYCSKQCQEAAWSQHHWLLCESATDAVDGDVNLVELFHSQALANNEILILAGRAFARVFGVYKRNGGDMSQAVRTFTRFQSENWVDVLCRDSEFDSPKEARKVRVDFMLLFVLPCLYALMCLCVCAVSSGPRWSWSCKKRTPFCVDWLPVTLIW